MADKMLKIELKKSLIGRGAKQIATAEALGLSLIHISLRLAMHKLPIKCKFVVREDSVKEDGTNEG